MSRSKMRRNGACVEAKRGETRREEQDRKKNYLVEEWGLNRSKKERNWL